MEYFICLLEQKFNFSRDGGTIYRAALCVQGNIGCLGELMNIQGVLLRNDLWLIAAFIHIQFKQSLDLLIFHKPSFEGRKMIGPCFYRGNLKLKSAV